MPSFLHQVQIRPYSILRVPFSWGILRSAHHFHPGHDLPCYFRSFPKGLAFAHCALLLLFPADFLVTTGILLPGQMFPACIHLSYFLRVHWPGARKLCDLVISIPNILRSFFRLFLFTFRIGCLMLLLLVIYASPARNLLHFQLPCVLYMKQRRPNTCWIATLSFHGPHHFSRLRLQGFA